MKVYYISIYLYDDYAIDNNIYIWPSKEIIFKPIAKINEKK